MRTGGSRAGKTGVPRIKHIPSWTARQAFCRAGGRRRRRGSHAGARSSAVTGWPSPGRV